MQKLVLRNKISKKLFFKRGIRFLPHLFTLGNAFFGFCSLVLVLEGELISAAYCIFLGAMMDALDGRVARLMRVESELGVEMDSLCDAITFCLAPAFLAYVWFLKTLGFFGVVLSSIFLLAGILRLARFNVMHTTQKMFFTGLPTTMAGCFLTALLLNLNRLSLGRLNHNPNIILVSVFLLLTLSWLMISSVRFPSFKQKMFGFKKNYHIVVAVTLFTVMAVMQFEAALLLLLAGYFLLTLGYHIYLGLGRFD